LASMAMYSMLAIKSKVPRGQFPTPAVDAT
jgi:hypothetical protein